MEARRFYSVLMVCAVAVCLVVGQAEAARTVKGTLVSAGTCSVAIKTDGDGKTVALKPAAGATIMRGQMGKQARKAKIMEFGAGDRVVAVVNDKGATTSVKGFYAISKGTLAAKRGDKVFFRDGRSVKLRPTLTSGSPACGGAGADNRPGLPCS